MRSTQFHKMHQNWMCNGIYIALNTNVHSHKNCDQTEFKVITINHVKFSVPVL